MKNKLGLFPGEYNNLNSPKAREPKEVLAGICIGLLSGLIKLKDIKVADDIYEIHSQDLEKVIENVQSGVSAEPEKIYRIISVLGKKVF